MDPGEPSTAGGTASSRSHTLTLLHADLAGSAQLARTVADGFPALLARFHRLVRDTVTAHGGRVHLTEGDRLLCVFPDAPSAVIAAHELQTLMAGTEWPGAATPLSRIGIHTGTVTGDLSGTEVDRARAITAAARAGQVLVSEATRPLVEAEARNRGWELHDLGAFSIPQREETERLTRVSFPDVVTVATAPRGRPTTLSRLPVPTTRLVGREEDIAGLAGMLGRARMVTVTGTGGIGKTRIALELAHRLETGFEDGAVFVDLSSVRSPDQVVIAVARSLGIYEGPDRSVLDALATVAGDAELLLVLDNLEQVEGAADPVGRLLDAMPRTRILATSRSPIRSSWEHEYPLGALPVPGPTASDEEVLASDAVILFRERASGVRPDFEVTPANRGAVAEITRRLDGLPLAIELAATRLRILTPELLLERLDDRLGTLNRGPADAPERHRTLGAAVAWSHDLLDEDEKTLFRRLGVFQGGLPFDAVPAVAGEGIADPTSVLEDLVTKSLVVFALDDDGEPRYRLLETLREFAVARLREAGEEDTIRARHLDWCNGLAARIQNELATPFFPDLLDLLERERHNLVAAFAWSEVQGGEAMEKSLGICGRLALFWDTRGFVTEGLEWTERLLAAAGPGTSPGRAASLSTVGWLAMLAGDPERSMTALTAADAMWREIGDPARLCHALAMRGMTTYNVGLLDEAEQQFREAISLVGGQPGLRWIEAAWCPYGLAHIALARGDVPTASEELARVLDYSRDNGLTWGVGHAQLSLGVLAFLGGDPGLAVERLAESLFVREQLRDARGICDCLGIMALIASSLGDQRLAAILLGAAQVRREASGHMPVPWQQPLLQAAAETAEAALGPDYPEAFAEGRGLAPQGAAWFVGRMRALASEPANS